jgi:hypothetical protein
VIKTSEIRSIEDIGVLENSPVKLLRTIGGLWVATGRPRGKKDDEALAAGSHPAIVKHNIEKMYGNRFQPAMAKSEAATEPKVGEHTSKLSRVLIDRGYTLHSIHFSDSIDFVVSKRGIEVLKHGALVKAEALEFQGATPKNAEGALEAISENVTRSIIFAAVDEANEIGKTQIVYKDIKYKVK